MHTSCTSLTVLRRTKNARRNQPINEMEDPLAEDPTLGDVEDEVVDDGAPQDLVDLVDFLVDRKPEVRPRPLTPDAAPPLHEHPVAARRVYRTYRTYRSIRSWTHRTHQPVLPGHAELILHPREEGSIPLRHSRPPSVVHQHSTLHIDTRVHLHITWTSASLIGRRRQRAGETASGGYHMRGSRLGRWSQQGASLTHTPLLQPAAAPLGDGSAGLWLWLPCTV